MFEKKKKAPSCTTGNKIINLGINLCFSRRLAPPTLHKPIQLAHPLLRGVICISETPGCLFIVLSQRPYANGSRGGLCCVGCTLHKLSTCGTARTYCRLEIAGSIWGLDLHIRGSDLCLFSQGQA